MSLDAPTPIAASGAMSSAHDGLPPTDEPTLVEWAHDIGFGWDGVGRVLAVVAAHANNLVGAEFWMAHVFVVVGDSGVDWLRSRFRSDIEVTDDGPDFAYLDTDKAVDKVVAGFKHLEWPTVTVRFFGVGEVETATE